MDPSMAPPEGAMSSPQESAAEDASETTCQVPVSVIGDAKEGDTVSLTVESIDEKSGMATLTPTDEAEQSENADNTNPQQSTIGQAASLFGKE